MLPYNAVHSIQQTKQIPNDPLRMGTKSTTTSNHPSTPVLDERGRITWASHIRCLLEKYSLSFVWISQGAGNVDIFMELYKIKLKEPF